MPPEAVADTVETAAAMVEGYRPMLGALSMIHQECLEKGLPPEVAAGVVLLILKQMEEEP